MRRFVSVIATMPFWLSTAIAQTNPVDERSMLMDAQGKYFYGRLLRDMIDEKKPYDQKIVDEAFATLLDTTRKLPGLFPDTAKGQSKDSDYYSSPKVWENKADFDARMAKFLKDAETYASSTKSLAALKVAFPAIRKDCDGCHEIYRLRKK